MRYLLFFIALGFLVGCDNQSTTSSLQLPEQGLSFKLEQRNSTTITHLPKELRIEIGDITRGQTMLTVWSGSEILHREALYEKKSAPFKWNNEKLAIECVQLDNELIGPDYAYLRLYKDEQSNSVQPVNSGLTEKQKIMRLIEITEKSQITFIRNGTEHTSQEAAEHLRTKYNYAGDKIQTAQQFIDEIASKSSTTNEPYFVRPSDGSNVRAKDWYTDRLKEVESEVAK